VRARGGAGEVLSHLPAQEARGRDWRVSGQRGRQLDEMGRPEVSFTMNRQGSDMMGKLTGENVGRKMAIVLDDKITSAPVIESKLVSAVASPWRIRRSFQAAARGEDLVAVLRSVLCPRR